MTEAIAALGSRLAAATATPWHAGDEPMGTNQSYTTVWDCNSEAVCRVFTSRPENLAFIANAPADIAALLAEVESLRALLADLRRYTMDLEGLYSLWAISRPSMAQFPEAGDLRERLDKTLAGHVKAHGEHMAERTVVTQYTRLYAESD